MICYQTNIELICLSDILLHNLSQAWLHITVSRTFPLLGQILNICYELQGIQAYSVSLAQSKRLDTVSEKLTILLAIVRKKLNS